ncbi:MAG: hypothetical protein ACKO2P_14680 [Planctomycetota bacterium]
MDEEQLKGCLAIPVLLLLLWALVMFVAYFVVPVLITLASAGVAWGSGHAVRNYIQAFRSNVRLDN